MAIVFACITPHGSEIVEALAGTNPSLMAKTRQSTNRHISFLSYEVPTYFGLLCAGVHVR